MATLKEMRSWARGEHVQGLPARKFKAAPRASPPHALKRTSAPETPLPIHITPAGGFSGAAAVAVPHKKKYGRPKYKISKDGTDALIQFGKHRGKRLSEIADMDPSYCDFIIGDDFPPDLKDVARFQKRESRERAKAIKHFEEEND